ncbi:MAG: CRISPR-associated endonuclease Cas3'' [Candidatus Micrarchaeota archaeon]|nr:CRISPR-associated endonuclease Cas3'' [Candidatus Micrarchaeota archaeon]
MKKFREFKLSVPSKIKFHKYLAHSEPREPLLFHMIKTKECFEKLLIISGLEDTFDTLIKNLFKEGNRTLAKQIIHDAIFFHDLGKLSLKFQRKIDSSNFSNFRNNKIDQEMSKLDEKHARLGWHMFLILYFKKMQKEFDDLELVNILAVSSIIALHHSSIKNWQEQMNEFLPTKKKLQKAVDYFNAAGLFFDDFEKRIRTILNWFEDNEEIFLMKKNKELELLIKLSQSFLILADSLAIKETEKGLGDLDKFDIKMSDKNKIT